MMLFDARTDVHQHAQGLVSGLSKIIWLLIAALIPAVVTALVKAMQDLSRSRRSQQLTDRISALAKSIADLPEVTAAGETPVTPRQALTAELNLVVAELYLLQTKTKHSVHRVSMNAAARVRSALLLFRPKGFGAWLLHLAFYAYGVVFVFCMLAVIIPTEGSAPFISTASAGAFFSDLSAVVLIVGIASVPMLLLRHYAARVHRTQLQAVDGQAPPSPSATGAVTVRVAASH